MKVKANRETPIMIKEVNEGKYDDKISGKTKLVEMSKEELDARKAELAKEAEAARAEAEAAKAAEAPEEETVAEAAEAEVQDQTHEKRDDKTSKD